MPLGAAGVANGLPERISPMPSCARGGAGDWNGFGLSAGESFIEGAFQAGKAAKSARFCGCMAGVQSVQLFRLASQGLERMIPAVFADESLERPLGSPPLYLAASGWRCKSGSLAKLC